MHTQERGFEPWRDKSPVVYRRFRGSRRRYDGPVKNDANAAVQEAAETAASQFCEMRIATFPAGGQWLCTEASR